MTKSNKFDGLSQEALLKACLELEDELERLRPRPAKFKLGQVAVFTGKHPYWPGQSGCPFIIQSVENKNGRWFYGYSKSSTYAFHCFPEDKTRALTTLEIDGTGSPEASPGAPPVALEAESPAGAGFGAPQAQGFGTPGPGTPIVMTIPTMQGDF